MEDEEMVMEAPVELPADLVSASKKFVLNMIKFCTSFHNRFNY
jgi:hypothetical protein